MAGPWIDGYIASTAPGYGSGGLYGQPGVILRWRTATATVTEELYPDEGDFTPSFGPSLIAARIDGSALRTLKLVFNTRVQRYTGKITVTDGYLVGGISIAGRIVYVTLSAPAELPSADNALAKPTSVTVEADAFKCWVANSGGYVGNSSTSSSITYGSEWSLDQSYTNVPMWAVCWAYFNRLTPPVINWSGIDTGGFVPDIPADPESTNQPRWYITNGAAEVLAGEEFVGTISAGGDSLHVPAKLVDGSTVSLKPYGVAVITELPAGQAWSVECTALDTCASSGGGSGGGGESVVTAIVYGGNCPETGSPFAENKPFIYNLDRFPKPIDPKKPENWGQLELPITFKHGDLIPLREGSNAPAVAANAAKWPDGVGVARLCRPFVLGTSRWDADIYTALKLEAIDSLPYYAGFKSNTQSKFYVYFNKPVIACDLVNVALTLNGSAHPTQTITGIAGVGTSRLEMTLSGAVVASSAVGVSFLASALTTRRITNTDNTTTDVKNSDTINISATVIDGVSWWMPGDAPTHVPAVTIRDAVYDPIEKTKLNVYFTGPVSTAPSITLSTPAQAITLSSPSISSDKVTYTLSAAPTDVQLATAVTVTSNGGETAIQGDIPSGPMGAGTCPLAVKAAKFCYVTVVNQSTEYSYNRGDLIDVTDVDPLLLSDKQSPVTTKSVYRSRLREEGCAIRIRITGGNTVFEGLDNFKIYGCKAEQNPTSINQDMWNASTKEWVYAQDTWIDGVCGGYLPNGKLVAVAMKFNDVAGAAYGGALLSGAIAYSRTQTTYKLGEDVLTIYLIDEF